MLPIIRSKIKATKVEAYWLERQSLVKDMIQNQTLKLLFLKAPSGYGKSVLVSQYLNTAAVNYSWYLIDETDNDLTIFIQYLIASIQESYESFGKQLQHILEVSQESYAPLMLVNYFINDLSHYVEDDFYLVFDDYHLIKNEAIHQWMERLIQYMPDNVHIILTSHQRLPYSVSHYHLNKQMKEYNEKDLRFSKLEIKSYLEKCHLSDDKLSQIDSQTDGWPVVIKLIQMSQGKSFSMKNMSNEAVINQYFEEHVFKTLPAQLQSFMLAIACLDYIDSELASYVSQMDSASLLLSDIVERQLFIKKTKDYQDAYYFHHLFKRFLIAKVDDDSPVFYERASRYYVEKENIVMAIQYAIKGKHENLVITYFNQAYNSLLKSVPIKRIEEWLKHIEISRQNRSAECLLMRSVVLNFHNQFTEAHQELDKAKRLYQEKNQTKGLILAKYYEAIFLRRQGYLELSIEVINQMTSELYSFSMADIYQIILEKVNTLLWIGALSEAIRVLTKAMTVAVKENNMTLLSLFKEHLGATYFVRGDYSRAIQYYNDSYNLMTIYQGNIDELELERYTQRTSLSRIYRDWGQLDKALSTIEYEIKVKERLALYDDLPRAYHQCGLIHFDLGHIEEAMVYFEKADKGYYEACLIKENDFQANWHQVVYGNILYNMGYHEEGLKKVNQARKMAESNSPFNWALCELIASYTYADYESGEKVIDTLKKALSIAQKIGAQNMLCQCHWALANAYLKHQQEEKAMPHIKECFTLAETGNYIQMFLSYQRTSLRIIEIAYIEAFCVDFVNKIILNLGHKGLELVEGINSSNNPTFKQRHEWLIRKMKQVTHVPLDIESHVIQKGEIHLLGQLTLYLEGHQSKDD